MKNVFLIGLIMGTLLLNKQANAHCNLIDRTDLLLGDNFYSVKLLSSQDPSYGFSDLIKIKRSPHSRSLSSNLYMINKQSYFEEVHTGAFVWSVTYIAIQGFDGTSYKTGPLEMGSEITLIKEKTLGGLKADLTELPAEINYYILINGQKAKLFCDNF